MRVPLIALLAALALGGLIPAAPAAQAQSAPARSVAPASGAPGTVFTVTVGGFKPGEEAGSWLVAPDGRSLDATPYLKIDGAGEGRWRWASPANAQAGTWQAVTRGRESRVEVAIPFSVGGANPAPVAPQPQNGSVSPASGAPGSTFVFAVAGFQRGEKVAFWPTQPDGSVQDERRRPVIADGAGAARVEWQAPARALSGTWTMTFRGLETRRELRVTFAIAAAGQAPAASVSPAAGPAGTTFSFQAGGFNEIERLDTWLEQPDGSRVGGPVDARADRDGFAVWSWTAPADARSGQWTMVAEGQDSERVERISFTITGATAPAPTAGVSPERGAPGTTFSFSASGFKHTERVGYWLNLPDGSIVRFDHELRADKDGRVAWSYTAPAGAPRGLYVMVARSSQSDNIDNDVSYALRFTVE